MPAALCEILRETFALSGDAFLRRLVCRLAAATGAPYAFASGPVDPTPAAPLRGRRYGFWLAEEYGQRFHSRAAERRRLGAAGLQGAAYPQLLERLFPGDRHLAGLDASRCYTVTLRSARGRLLGHLGVLDPGTASAPDVEELLGVVAARAAMEMERLAAERTYRRIMARLMARRERMQLVTACAWCRQVRDGDRYSWVDMESYVRKHFGIDFTHGICPSCLDEQLDRRHWPQVARAAAAGARLQ